MTTTTQSGYTVELIEEMLKLGFMSESEANEARAELNLPPLTNPDIVTVAIASEAAPVVPPVEEEVVVSNEEIEAAVANERERAALYAEQESTVNVSTIIAEPSVKKEVANNVVVALKSVKAPKTAATPREPRRTLSGGMSIADYVKSLLGNSIHFHESNVTRPTHEVVESIKAVKVREKAVDLVDAIAKGHRPSVYTVIGIREIVETGGMNSVDLAKRMMSGKDGKSYTEGTARAQSQQVHSIFKTFGIIGSDSKLVAGNDLWAKLEGYATAPAPEEEKAAA